MNNKILSWDIIKCLESRHARDIAYPEVNLSSSGSRRMDYFAIKPTWSPITFIGYEVKVSRQDFLNDTKWFDYLDCCHMFYFAAPKGLINVSELPAQIGLVEYNPEKGTIRTKKRAIYRKIEHGPMLVDIMLHILMWKATAKEQPLPKRVRIEMWEDWLNDKDYSHEIGRKVSSKISILMREHTHKQKQKQRDKSKYENITDVYTELTGDVYTGYNDQKIIDMLRTKVKDSGYDRERLMKHVKSAELEISKINRILSVEQTGIKITSRGAGK